MSTKPTRRYLRDLLEDPARQKVFQEILDEALTKRKETVYVDSHEVKYDKDGTKHVRNRKMPVEIERYPLKDLERILGLMLSFGVGKPVEEKKVEINVNQRISEMSDAELEIVAGEYRELNPGE